MRPAAPPACEGQGQDVTKTHTLRTGLGCGAPPRRPDGRLWRPNQRGTCPQPVCLADARGKRQAGSGRARRQRRLWTLPQGGQYGINWAATRACGYCASATLRDEMVASGQTLMAVTAQLPWGRPHPVDQPSHGHDRAAGSRATTAYGSQLAASLAGRAGASFRPSTRVVYEEKAISQAAGFLDDPEGLREVLDVVDQLAEDPRPAGSFQY